MKVVNRAIIIVCPRQPYVDWVQSLNIAANKLTLEGYKNDCLTYLVPLLDKTKEYEEVVKSNFVYFFEQALDGYSTDKDKRPKKIDIKLFYEWFEVHFHTVVEDLSEAPLIREDW